MQAVEQRTDAQIQWLVDRAAIQDLLFAYARNADTKNWDGFAELFAEEGELILPFGSVKKSDMAASCERILRPFAKHTICSQMSRFRSTVIPPQRITICRRPISRPQKHLPDMRTLVAGTTTRFGAPLTAGGWSR
jgi:hypothetical protein